ncbi:MAG: hypothetical protein EBU90_09820 [Proteobacteria bacterium]|nr:hypothetical protein [Pseudomonadota bacterium]NBP14549.1 hypothetical protein [bacterium]
MNHISKIAERLQGKIRAVSASLIVSEEVKSERLNICLQCEYLVKPTNQCTKCGCLMNLKTKLKEVNCPIGKW